MNKLTVIIAACVLVIIGAAATLLIAPEVKAPILGGNGTGTDQEPTTFAECVAAGNPVMESYPRQCNSPGGRHFVEDIGNALEKIDLIQAMAPQPGDTISSPLVVTGEARGYWYFEASFPISVINASGQEIGQGYAQAQGEWMTEEFVPFESVPITFTAQPKGSMGKVILHKDNPSGLPENDDQLEIPIVF